MEKKIKKGIINYECERSLVDKKEKHKVGKRILGKIQNKSIGIK